MKKHPVFRAHRDLLIALGLFLLVSLCAALTLHGGQPLYSDDFAAYLNQTFAFVDGRLDEMTRLNVLMHPSTLSFLPEGEEQLVYSWGIMLLLAPIYALIGFDRGGFANVHDYKLPGALMLGLVAFAFYLLMRKRFSTLSSLLLSCMLSFHTALLDAVNVIGTDLPGLAFALLAIAAFEYWLDETGSVKRIWLACLGGCLFWAAAVTRLNGLTVLFSCIVLQLWRLFSHRPLRRSFEGWLDQLAPYLFFALLWILTACVLPAITSNTSDLGTTTPQRMLRIFQSYWTRLIEWLGSCLEPGTARQCWLVTGWVMAALCVAGLFRSGGHNLALTVLGLATLLGAVLLPYTQGIRYLFNLFPALLLWLAEGTRWLWGLAAKHLSRLRSQQTGALLAALLLLLGSAFNTIGERFMLRGADRPYNDFYNTASVELYRYIQSDTPEDAVIAYFMPRALYLNTGRVAFRPQIEPAILDAHESYDHYLPYQSRFTPLDTADYVLTVSIYPHSTQMVEEELAGSGHSLQLIYQNDLYSLFKLV